MKETKQCHVSALLFQTTVNDGVVFVYLKVALMSSFTRRRGSALGARKHGGRPSFLFSMCGINNARGGGSSEFECTFGHRRYRCTTGCLNILLRQRHQMSSGLGGFVNENVRGITRKVTRTVDDGDVAVWRTIATAFRSFLVLFMLMHLSIQTARGGGAPRVLEVLIWKNVNPTP